MRTLLATLCVLLAPPALAGDMADQKISIQDGYALFATPNAKAGAAFMQLENQSDNDLQLTNAASGIAKKTELHTHEMVDGIAKMRHVEEGFTLKAGDTLLLERGGYHVMFMGLDTVPEAGDCVAITLSFDQHKDIEIMLPVMIGKAAHQHGTEHSSHNMSGDGDREVMGAASCDTQQTH